MRFIASYLSLHDKKIVSIIIKYLFEHVLFSVIMTVSSSSSEEPRKSWMDLINESVHTSDDIDIGDIMAVSRDFVVVKRGFVNVHYYYITISKVEGWDGHVLWLKITESEVKENYER